ncbi:MAG TPA: DUF3160 domain-containing protein [bacterium]|nr:DUF3160 domain-containing protein [bacterium]
MKRFFVCLAALAFVLCSCANNIGTTGGGDGSPSEGVAPLDGDTPIEEGEDIPDGDIIPVSDDPIGNGETTSTAWEAAPAFIATLRDGIGGGFVADLAVAPTAPNYTLPITGMGDIVNFQRDIVEKLGISLTVEAQEKLLANGFVVLPGSSTRFDYLYSQYQSLEVPVFVSADSILHLYHLYFDQILKNIEIAYFTEDLKLLMRALLAETGKIYNSFSDKKLKDAALLAYGQCSVILRLLDDSFAVNALVAEPVVSEIEQILAHNTSTGSALFSYNCPKTGDDICQMGAAEQSALSRSQECYCEDFTQYKPRGHYTQTETLQRYFRAMMYVGRMAYLMKSDRATMAGAMLTHALKKAKASDGRNAKEIWERIYRVTAFFAGNADDLLPPEYDAAFIEVFGAGKDIALLTDAANMKKYTDKIETLRDPKILGGIKHALLDSREVTKGLRLMGQRFVPDSYMLGESVIDGAGIDTTNPHKAEILAAAENQTSGQSETSCLGISTKDPLTFTSTDMYCACEAGMFLYRNIHPDDPSYLYICRYLPSGLDAMAGLGSSAAKRVLAAPGAFAPTVTPYNYVLLPGTHDRLESEFSGYTPADWGRNLYFGWLYLLKPMMKGYDGAWPVFMQTEAWEDFTLNSALGSWSQLRHDTILYVKQSYTEYVDSTVADEGPTDEDMIYDPKYYAYAEPIPALFDRAAQLTGMTLDGLTELGLFTNEMNSALTSGKAMMEKVRDLSIAQLQTGVLPEDDAVYLMRMGSMFTALIKELAKIVTVVEGEECSYCSSQTWIEGDGVNDPFDVRLVADVHSNPSLSEVLETATGPTDILIVVRKMDNGSLGAAIGPVFSYREFSWSITDRLTDEQWRTMIKIDTQKFVPQWTGSFKVQ